MNAMMGVDTFGRGPGQPHFVTSYECLDEYKRYVELGCLLYL